MKNTETGWLKQVLTDVKRPTITYWRVERISDRKLLHESNNLKSASAFMEWYLKIKNVRDHSNHRMVEVTEKELWVGTPPISKKK